MRKLKLTKADRAYLAGKGREGGIIGNHAGKAAGGKKGGKSRMASMTPDERRELASKAGRASAAKRKAKDSE